MKFSCTHTFKDIDLKSYESLYFDESFCEALCEEVKLRREVIRLDRTDEKLVRELRVSPNREIPKPMAKVLGSDRIEYIESVEYVFGSGQARWKTTPQLMADRFHCAGTIVFHPRGNDIERAVEGEIKVKVFGIGGMVEKFIVADIEKSYEAAADFTRLWLAKNR